MHQRCVRWPARVVLCVVPSAWCPVWGAQCPVKGHYWTPGARRKKGGWLGRPGQARPQGSRTSQGSGRATFHSSFSFKFFLLFLLLIHLQRFCFLSPNHLKRRVRVHFPGGLFILPPTRPDGLCSGNASRPRHRTNTGNASSLQRPTKKQWRTKGRMVGGDMDLKTKSEETQQNKS